MLMMIINETKFYLKTVWQEALEGGMKLGANTLYIITGLAA
jgi:hypothetical protein